MGGEDILSGGNTKRKGAYYAATGSQQGCNRVTPGPQQGRNRFLTTASVSRCIFGKSDEKTCRAEGGSRDGQGGGRRLGRLGTEREREDRERERYIIQGSSLDNASHLGTAAVAGFRSCTVPDS